MKFINITLNNFSSFYKQHSIEFHTKTECPVSIIVGGSGFGKTSIFDAINWALYGKEYENVLRIQYQKDILDYINETALKEALPENNAVEMSSTLLFEHDEKRYRVEQAICVKNNNGRLYITDRTTSLYDIHSNGNWTEISFIESFLNAILPNNVRDYFLFNGDRINQLSMPGASKYIQEGIYHVVDLEIIQSGIDHLEFIAKKYRKLAKNNSTGVVADIEEKYSNAREELDRLESIISQQNDELMALENNIEIVEAKLREMSEVKDLQAKRDALKREYDIELKNFNKITSDLRNVTSIAIMDIILPTLLDLRDELNNKRSKGEIPSKISESLLKDILELRKCICGTEFEEGDSIYQELTRRLEIEVNKRDQGNDLLELYFELNSTIDEIERSKIQVITLELERTKIDQKIKEINRELHSTMEKLKDKSEEEIKQLVSNLEEYRHNYTDIIININRNESKKVAIENEIRELQKIREEQGKIQDNVRQFQLRDDLAQQSADELTRIFKQFIDESREEIQSLTREEFVRFIPTASNLNVAISPEFHYDVRDQYGRPALQQLSNGQRQALSLAYITAISRVSEKNPPLVIDMPFGRLDEDVQENIAERLPNLASQVILLMLPGAEWNDKTREILYKKTADIYNLDFDPENRQSSIRKEK
jgi:DNA sulfur modification protein DndD